MGITERGFQGDYMGDEHIHNAISKGKPFREQGNETPSCLNLLPLVAHFSQHSILHTKLQWIEKKNQNAWLSI